MNDAAAAAAAADDDVAAISTIAVAVETNNRVDAVNVVAVVVVVGLLGKHAVVALNEADSIAATKEAHVSTKSSKKQLQQQKKRKKVWKLRQI